jgi:hypothetical protein
MESADNVKNLITSAEASILEEAKSTERLQHKLYFEFLNLLTNERFFTPLLTSLSREIVGRFCLESRMAINASFYTPGLTQFRDSPGYFQVSFISSGLPNITLSFDKNLCLSLTSALSPHVRKCVETHLKQLGWECWWTSTHFCFQEANRYYLIQDSILLGSLFPPSKAPPSSRVEQSRLVRFDGSVDL